MRSIIEGPEFQRCVERLGGARAVDAAMEAVMDGLMRNPYGFPKFENDWTSFRCVRTRPIEGFIPSLVIVFRIDESSRSVILEWVDEIDDGELPS